MDKAFEPAALRALPSMQRLLEQAAAASPRAALIAALRTVLDEIRAEVRAGSVAIPPDAEILRRATMRLAGEGPVLRRVINATGIILHTNFGRAPLATGVAVAVSEAAQGYSNLEYDLDAGTRGTRLQGVEPLLLALTGAEAAVAVNNGAAAMLLALAALAGDGEVIVSRGELVEIGGGFRIPDVIRQGGARLVEVGTTNCTRLADYCAAITPATRVILKVHQSNYRISGFTAESSLSELAELAGQTGLLLMQDLGSGSLVDLRSVGRAHEPTVRQAVVAGADLVAFSGDKLLGGPQAGLAVGRAAAIEPLRKHPLMRALRLDKMVLAALEATLRLHRDDPGVLPVVRMLSQSEAVLQSRAAALRDHLAQYGHVDILTSDGVAGGGTLPDQVLPSRAVALDVPGLGADELARRLRRHRPAVVGCLRDGRLRLDVLAVEDVDIPAIAAAVAASLP